MFHVVSVNMVVPKDLSSNLLTYLLVLFFVFILASNVAGGGLKRCFRCRSRGDLGSCKDPFQYNNSSSLEKTTGVQTIPCASGWCGKILEVGANEFKDEEYGVATERLCLQYGPSDNEERCAPAAWGNSKTKVQICFCQGDLCNSAISKWNINFVLTTSIVIVAAFSSNYLRQLYISY